MITENLSTLKINKLTQEQYDRELEEGNIDENALYLTPDEVKFNKVLCDSGDTSVSVLTDGAVEIPEINNYSIFAVYLNIRDWLCCAVLCTKSTRNGVEYITGFNNFIQPSNSDMFFRFRGSIQGATLTDVKAQWTDLLVDVGLSDNDGSILLSQGIWVDATVSKIVGIM